jgi:hypothetical protein
MYLDCFYVNDKYGWNREYGIGVYNRMKMKMK